MAEQTRSGFSFAGERVEITEYVIPASDTSPYAIGDPIVALGELFVGRLPDGRNTQGMFTAELASSGAPVSGVIVGILPTSDTAGNVCIPEEKFHSYVVRARSVEDAVFEIQCDNAAKLTTLGAGTTANFVAAAPNGSVSGFYVDATSLGSGIDLVVLGIGRNFGANSSVYVRFVTAPAGFSSGVPSEFTSRALTSADDGDVLVCASSQTATVNTGLPTGFGCSFKGAISFAGTATVTDVRTTGAANPWCALVQTGTNTYDAVGGKA